MNHQRTVINPLDLSGVRTTLKIIILGDAGVGKTTLCNALLHDNADDYDDTDDAPYSPRVVPFNNSVNDCAIYHMETEDYGEVCIHLWDTVGEEYTECTSNVFRNANGIILMYDITSYRSFQSISTRWLPRVRQLLGDGGTTDDVLDDRAMMERDNIFKLLIVANKVDLVAQRQVRDEECRLLTHSLKIPYIQLSSIDTRPGAAKLPFILLTKQLVPVFMSLGGGRTSSRRITLGETDRTTTTTAGNLTVESSTCC